MGTARHGGRSGIRAFGQSAGPSVGRERWGIGHAGGHRRVAGSGAERERLAHQLYPLHHLAEHNVLVVEVLGLLEGDEELGAVGVLATVGHR